MKSIKSSPNPDPDGPCDSFCFASIADKLPCFLFFARFLVLWFEGWLGAGPSAGGAVFEGVDANAGLELDKVDLDLEILGGGGMGIRVFLPQQSHV